MPNQHTGPAPVEQRFRSKIDTSGGPDACWPWIAARNNNGYGLFWCAGRLVLAHRFAYELAHGPLADDQRACHDCPEGDNPACCNAAHLFAGTQAANIRDMVTKGRVARGEHLPGAKLTAEGVRELRRRRAEGETITALARAFGVSRRTTRDVVARRYWRHVM
jgi:hypothetical protein